MWDKCSPRCGTLLTLETLNSQWCRPSDRPEVKMRYWGLLRMWKTKLESLFSSRRLTTCVSEVVFGRLVVIHFFCLLLNMPWKKNHIPVFLRIPWSQLTKLKLFTYWRTFSSFIVIASPEITKAEKITKVSTPSVEFYVHIASDRILQNKWCPPRTGCDNCYGLV